MKNKKATAALLIVVLNIGCLASFSQAQTTPVTIQRTINLVNVWNNDGVYANDFHIRFKAKDLDDNYVGTSYLDTTGYWNVLPGVSNINRNVTYDNGYIDIYYSWDPAICVDPGNPGQFGFTLLGGVQYEDVTWNWTLNGNPVQEQDDVWQDWVKVWNGSTSQWELQDVIRNRETSGRNVQRTIGYSTSPVTIADVAVTTNALLPGRTVLDTTPVTINPGNIVIQPWPWPGADPSYYMYYDLYNSSGTLEASFQNVAVLGVPEPGAIVLLITGLATLLLWWRRRN